MCAARRQPCLSITVDREAHMIAIVPGRGATDGWQHLLLCEPCPSQRRAHPPRLPIELRLIGEMLELAAATCAKDRADGLHPLRRRFDDGEHAHYRRRHMLGSFASWTRQAPGGFYFDDFAGQPADEDQFIGCHHLAAPVDLLEFGRRRRVQYLDDSAVRLAIGKESFNGDAIAPDDITPGRN